MIKIDHRETQIKSHFSNVSDKTYKISFQLLELGDILLSDSDGTDKIFIERKTVSDLASSIKSGRYKEQKYRALDTFSPDNIIFLIEGRLNSEEPYINGIPSKTLQSACLNMIMRDKLRLIQTSDIQHTLDVLDMIFLKWINEGTKWWNLSKKVGITYIHTNYLQTLVPRKKNNLTPELCYLLQLSQIPGISTKFAKLIASKYKNMGELIKLINKSNGINKLASISYTTEEKKIKRKIGNKLALRIYYFLTGHQHSSTT